MAQKEIRNLDSLLKKQEYDFTTVREKLVRNQEEMANGRR